MIATLVLGWFLVTGAPPCAIDVIVLDSDVVPLPYAWTKLRREDDLSEVRSGTTCEDGRFLARLPSGDRHVLDLFMPGFSIATIPLACGPDAAPTTAKRAEVIIPVHNTQFLEAPRDFVDRPASVCAIQANGSALRLSDGSRVKVRVEEGVARRWDELGSVAFRANVRFQWTGKRRQTTFRIYDLWW